VQETIANDQLLHLAFEKMVMNRQCFICFAAIAFATFLIQARPKAIGQELQKTAFVTPSKSGADTLFAQLDSSTTHILVDNAYDDPKMWGDRYREYMGGSMGSGIAAGDFDSDGKVDLYVSLKTKPGRLFRNMGDWYFEDVTEKAGLAEKGSFFSWLKSAVSSDEDVIWRHGAVFADVNNDGLLDLYVCRNGAQNFLYMNQGDGTFEEEAEKRGLGLADGSVVGAFADYDRDGWMDVLILTNQVDGTETSGRADRLFRNMGDGHFVETTDTAGISGNTFGHAVVWFDYNEDKWPDFYIANDYAGPDYLYRNNGDGTFTDVIDSVVPHSSYSTMGVDTADVDNNGHIDLFLGDMAATSREKERRRKSAASKEDLLKMGNEKQIAPQYTRNSLLLNTGLGYFREAACWAGLDATDWTWSVRFEDFDNDGWVDLHVTNGMVREANNSDLLSRMMQARSTSQRIGVMNRSPRLEESNLAFRNKAGVGFERVTKEWGLAEIGVSFGAATADFDNDGDLDIVYLNHDGGVSVYRNDVSEQHRIQIRLRGKQSNRFGIGAVIRVESSTGLQSRTLSSARGYSSGSEVVAHFGLGFDTKIKRLVVEWPSGVEQSFSDLEADFSYLIEEDGIVQERSRESRPALFEQKGSALGLTLKDESRLAISDTEQTLLPFRTDRRGPGVAIADLDGNGRDDIYIAATTGSPARLLRWKGGHYESEPLEGLAESTVEDGPPLFLDVDGNGTRDLLITKASADARAWPHSYQPIFYANDGSGNFSPTNWLPKLEMNVGAVCAADIDGDGDLDLFMGARSVPGRYPETPRSALLVADGGKYVDASERSPELENVGLVKSALFRDLDMDGSPDLLVALEWDYVRYFHNDGSGVFSDWTERSGFDTGGRGWWNSLESGDFNGDGKLDFAVGNLGLNTTYNASPEHPSTLFYGPFGQSGPKLIVEAVYDGDVLYPLRSRGDISGRLAHALRRYPKSDDYARADIVEVFGEKALELSEAYLADNFYSGVFLSQSNGSYQFSAFPSVAQIGPMQGIVASDFDGDGLTDICAVQNSDIATPSFHGGVGILLKGKGDGLFEAVEPSESGILLQGNGRALALLDPSDEARPSLFLTRHRGSSEFLLNASTDARWLKIKLAGDGQNPDAIGAQVELQFANTERKRYEVGLGGGWLSQSASAIFTAIPKNTQLIGVTVRWPDGETTEHSDFPEQGIWRIDR
jgi:hypothetical protein